MSHRNDWRFTAGLFALTSLFESLAFGHLSAFTPLYLRELHVPGGAVAIIAAGSPVGMAVGPYAGGLVVERWGIRTLLYTDAILTGIVILVLILFLRDEPREQNPHADTRSGVKDAIRGITHDSNV